MAKPGSGKPATWQRSRQCGFAGVHFDLAIICVKAEKHLLPWRHYCAEHGSKKKKSSPCPIICLASGVVLCTALCNCPGCRASARGKQVCPSCS